MNPPIRRLLQSLAAAVAVLAWPVWAALTIPGADGSDGVLAPVADVVIDLSLARTGAWDSPGNGYGVYDPVKWAVVFKYRSVNIPAGKTVTFKNHPSRAPVVWLVSGDASIAGTLNLDGQNWVNPPKLAEPGPGGFQGGIGFVNNIHTASGGFGIGGGGMGVYGGNHATAGYANAGWPTYGTARVLPLIGGSGGGGDAVSAQGGGGAGGGALLLAVSGTLSVNGSITANGGYSVNTSGSGAGGAVRLIADTISGTGRVYAMGSGQYGGLSGWGRIRLEAIHPGATWDLNPLTTVMAPDAPILLWPPAAAPTVRVVSVGGKPAPADPRANFAPGQQDLTIEQAQTGTIVLETTHVDPGLHVKVRVTPEYGAPMLLDAAFGSGDLSRATWTATTALPTGNFTVQAHAVNPAP